MADKTENNDGITGEFLTKRDVAKMLHRTTRTVELLVKQGLLPCIYLTKRTVLFDGASVRAALLARQVGGVR